MGFKGLQELHQHFIFSFLALDDIRVSLSIIDILDITDFNKSTLIFIDLVKGLAN